VITNKSLLLHLVGLAFIYTPTELTCLRCKTMNKNNSLYIVKRGADKSLARPTSQCHRTEWVVLLERGVCSCAELQVFSCYRKETCQVTCTISTTSRCELSSFFSARQDALGNSHHSDRNIRGTCTIVSHGQKLGGSV
jgi:hypothetical protein